MKSEPKLYKVWRNGTKVEMTYDEVCHALDIIPESHFVRITTAGTVTFTTGKPDEIRFLYNHITDNGFRASSALTYTINRL